MTYKILQGDNRDLLKILPDNSIDSIVTDPPYGIDFLGKSWDANTGALETYQECLRVLKPGGHILAFSAARTYHHLAITLEQAGFEIRDQIMWIYSSGFPKAQQVPGFEGWKNGGLKPGHEPIALARKPSKISIEKNMKLYGVGALNIDSTRIPYENEKDKNSIDHKVPTAAWSGHTIAVDSYVKGAFEKVETNDKGRFPSNVIGEIQADYQKYFYCPKVSRKERHIGFDIGSERFDQSNGEWIKGDHQQTNSKGNNHPTVKPVALMEYLIKLITPPGGTVLDPFCGSGSTGMAAVELGYEFIGCELDPNYVKIAETRIEAWSKRDTADNTFEELFHVA